MLKPHSIEKIRASQKKCRLRAYNQHQIRLREKMDQIIELSRWRRNQGAVVTGNGESLHHKFCKFCCAMALEESEYDYISEYKLKGFECDIFSPNLNFFIELETNLTKSKKESKLNQFRHIANSSNCDLFLFDIKEIPNDYIKAVDYFKGKLGI